MSDRIDARFYFARVDLVIDVGVKCKKKKKFFCLRSRASI